MFPGSFSEASFLASSPFLIDFWILAGHDWLPEWPSGRIPGSPKGCSFFEAGWGYRLGASQGPLGALEMKSEQQFMEDLVFRGENWHNFGSLMREIG